MNPSPKYITREYDMVKYIKYDGPRVSKHAYARCQRAVAKRNK